MKVIINKSETHFFVRKTIKIPCKWNTISMCKLTTKKKATSVNDLWPKHRGHLESFKTL